MPDYGRATGRKKMITINRATGEVIRSGKPYRVLRGKRMISGPTVRAYGKKQGFVAKVERAISRMSETKYVAHTIKTNEALTWNLDALTAYQTMFSLLPPVARGNNSHTRVGDCIEPVKLRVHLEYSWDKDFQWQYEPYVRQFICTNKTVKSEEQWAPNYPAIATTEQAKLLDNGDGTHTFPTGSVVVDAVSLRKPGNKTAWTFHKGTRHFYMTKNQGSNNSTLVVLGQPVQPHAMKKSTVNLAYNIATPKKLKYDTDTSTKPTGFLPLFGAIVGLEGNQDIASGQPSGIGPLSVPGGRPNIQMINLTVRVEMWYKDI